MHLLTPGLHDSGSCACSSARPVFLPALLKPVTWLDRQRKVQTAMERIGEEIELTVPDGDDRRGVSLDSDPPEGNNPQFQQ